MLKKNLFLIGLFCFCLSPLFTQEPIKQTPEGPSTTPTNLPATDSVTVTIIMKHQQDKNLTEIRRKLEANGFWDLFPPADARVISWQIVVSMGHLITLKIPAGSIRRLNLAIENGAWGAYDTEIYISYDYLPVWRDYIEKRMEAKEDKD